jgi:hypothetical protein
MNRIQISTTLLIVTLATAATAVFALLTSKTIHNTGNIKTIGIGVYKEKSCDNPVSTIEWNDLAPGENRTVIVYIRNEGTVVVVLNARADNWNPIYAPNYIRFAWNRENYTLPAGAVVEATLSLKVSDDVSGIQSFSFDIIIKGTEM